MTKGHYVAFLFGLTKFGATRHTLCSYNPNPPSSNSVCPVI
jgi:hypothetical protein